MVSSAFWMQISLLNPFTTASYSANSEKILRWALPAALFMRNEREYLLSWPCNRMRSVAGAVQLFRCECYEGIGGISPLRNGGEDWCAEVSARMMGWTVKAFPGTPHFSSPSDWHGQ